jgi:hypothetical protein
VAIPHLVKAWKFDPNAPENRPCHAVSANTLIEFGLLHLRLTGLFGVMTYDVHQML